MFLAEEPTIPRYLIPEFEMTFKILMLSLRKWKM